jgi:catechol 2,3-dioxygenase
MADPGEIRQDGEAPRDPEELDATAKGADVDLSPLTRMGPVHLTVADMERSLAFYRESVGLIPGKGDGSRIELGSGERVLLVLIEEPGAQPANGRTGLYHFALLVPERRELASWLAHAARDQVPMTGLADHFVSEALYLRDPDEHGIEIYWDRPREVWEGQVAERITTMPLDTGNLFGELDDPASEPFEGLPGGTVMGHVHLRVADIAPAVDFYRDVLGFGLMGQFGEQAAFLAAGGYHHHLGANVWESAGAPWPEPGMAALRHFTIVLPDAAERDRVLRRMADAGYQEESSDEGPLVRDPSGNLALLAVSTE